ncbi:M42 family metallopeptidase [Isachenkonia alkalipeptolytica]|uniref:M42 family metallopeptidase n=1 Tax=Isachenkonia alkalipeptolytica TaxID=2565777 RepID=A0AA44BDX2_9CLOT|nr:M42 family metallopeptidase [Isachenkonia alkalipeptolytica]NBG88754.1 M42 family metallopeptidase [Isachenkonia alkalipeptolytica]
MDGKQFLQYLSQTSGVSGHEEELTALVDRFFKPYADSITTDTLGNIIVLKKGRKSTGKIMFAAHLDEIGLMVKKIDEKGYLHMTSIGGFDQRVLPCQEVTVHGKEELFGVIGMLPPHITGGKQEDSVKMEDLLIDVGYSKQELKDLVSIGDIVTVNRSIQNLKNNQIAGKALDDRAGVVALYEGIKLLQDQIHDMDVYFVLTVQEEVGTRGAVTSTYGINPDVGLAVDVGFGRTPELNAHDTLELSKGPGILIGANAHPNVFKSLKDTAKKNHIDYQIEVAPGPTGTDAWPMQISGSGVATGVLSIPLRYMHTSVETINWQDVETTGQLLSHFVMYFNSKEMEDFLCY